MSFEINGETWQPQGANSHAESIMAKINQILQENDIRDKNGELIQLTPNYANALYLLALGDGERLQTHDQELSQAINSFNIELCDDQQIENLLPIAAISRNPGSYSTLRLAVTSTDDGTCTIPAGTTITYNDVQFVVQNEVILTPGTTQIITTVCNTIGPVVVLTGEINAFDSPIANLESVENFESSIPGVAPETTNQLRQRLLKGDVIKYSLEGCKKALEELTGVTYARIYFNYNINETITLDGGVVLQPRTAYIVIYGSSDKIADTYATYMNMPTQNSPIATGSPSIVTVSVTATTNGSAVIPIGTTATYDDYTFETQEEYTIPAGGNATVQLVCTETGPINVPVGGITEFNQTITNLLKVEQFTTAIPGYDNPARSQDWVTSSGQIIPIKYDLATQKNVFIKVVLAKGADYSQETQNQLKKDLIKASASWELGSEVTSLLAGSSIVNVNYTDVLYCKVSEDGETWSDNINLGCNVVARVLDSTISIVQSEA